MTNQPKSLYLPKLNTQINSPAKLNIDLSLRYFRLFETTQDGILMLNFSTEKIENANPFMTNFLGCSKEKLFKKPALIRKFWSTNN